MSAICGFIQFDGRPVEVAVLEMMVKSSPYRGADVRLDNRDELFSKLELHKDTNRVVTDANLTLAAWLKWDKACVEHFLGAIPISVKSGCQETKTK